MSALLDHLHVGEILDGIAEGVTVAGPDGRIVYSNRAAHEILGVPAARGDPSEWGDHYGVYLADGSAPFPSAQYPLLRALRGEETRDVEMLIRNANRPAGTLISVTGRPLVRDGHVVGAAVVFRDITGVRSAQRWKDAFFAFALHDLKNPITSILALADLLVVDSASRETRVSDLHDLRDAAMRMTRMVRNMLDVRLAEDGALKPNLRALPVIGFLDDMYTALAPRVRAVGQRLVEPVCPDDLVVLGDSELLSRVIQNLVDNGMKYGPVDGRIQLDAERSEGGRALLRVRDEGPGVPEELRERIFDMYATHERADTGRSVTSSGLGLRFCAVVAEAHRGRIWVEDGHPVGAVFNLEIPAV